MSSRAWHLLTSTTTTRLCPRLARGLLSPRGAHVAPTTWSVLHAAGDATPHIPPAGHHLHHHQNNNDRFLRHARELECALPAVLANKAPEGLLHEDVQLVDRFTGVTVHGRRQYELALACFLYAAHLPLAQAHPHVCWVQTDVARKEVVVRWALVGARRFAVRPEHMQATVEVVSTFTLANDPRGTIMSHVLDRRLPLKDDEAAIDNTPCGAAGA